MNTLTRPAQAARRLYRLLRECQCSRAVARRAVLRTLMLHGIAHPHHGV